MKEHILVILSGILKLVEKTKWPEEPLGIEVCGKFEKQCTRIAEECECFVYERQKREAFEGGALVEVIEWNENDSNWVAIRTQEKAKAFDEGVDSSITHLGLSSGVFIYPKDYDKLREWLLKAKKFNPYRQDK